MTKKDSKAPFWKTKKMSDMSRAEWESLCDGCGKCCLVKLRDADTNKIHFTSVACKQLDLRNCRCKDYKHRKELVPDCVQLTPRNIGRLDWLPETCAYVLIHRGKELYDWHPLVSGDPRSVHRAGMSMRNRVQSETKVEDPEDHVIKWVK
jgi:uncharacterized protein